MGIRKLCIKEVTPYIQDSLYDFYDYLDNILYNVYSECRFDNMYKYIYVLLLVHYKPSSLAGFLSLGIVCNECHYLDWTKTIYQQQQPYQSENCSVKLYTNRYLLMFGSSAS